MKTVLRKVVGVDEPTALAIFSGVRTADASSFIRRCFDARKETIPPVLHAALSQIASINAFRNDLVHYTPSMVGDEVIVTNASVSIRPEAIRRVEFKLSVLVEHIVDLWLIFAIFESFPDRVDQATAHLVTDTKKPRPWLAKAREPTSGSRKSRKRDTRPKPKRPPQP